MIVYVVERAGWAGNEVVAVFSNRDAAQRCAEEKQAWLDEQIDASGMWTDGTYCVFQYEVLGQNPLIPEEEGDS